MIQSVNVAPNDQNCEYKNHFKVMQSFKSYKKFINCKIITILVPKLSDSLRPLYGSSLFTLHKTIQLLLKPLPTQILKIIYDSNQYVMSRLSKKKKAAFLFRLTMTHFQVEHFHALKTISCNEARLKKIPTL